MKKTIKVLEELAESYLIDIDNKSKKNEYYYCTTEFGLSNYRIKHLRKAIKALKSVKKEPKRISIFVNPFEPRT